MRHLGRLTNTAAALEAFGKRMHDHRKCHEADPKTIDVATRYKDC
jgi:hypothetical protein